MPELPEVETVRRGLHRTLTGHQVRSVKVREPRLRWPVDPRLADLLASQTLRQVDRRGKYLLLRFDDGVLLMHLGMSGSVRFEAVPPPPAAHDHVDLGFDHGLLRYHDPRRFGAILWHARASGDVAGHPLLRSLGIEPFDPAFDGEHMYRATRGRGSSIKQVLLAGDVVVGVGNIYASESLFRAGIRPTTAAARIGAPRYRRLAHEIRQTLAEAIERGGSTLRDFVASDGQPGYFQSQARVYGRAGEACVACGRPIRLIRQQQRATYFCPGCQR